MFVAEDIIVGVECRGAQARFLNLLPGDLLAAASQTAYGQMVSGLLRVGPAGGAAAKLVRASFLDPIYRDDTMSIGLRWEAAGATGGLFPVLDATITISPGGQHTARLALAGCYRPPLGRLGTALDTAILHRVATATVRSLLRDVAEAITSPAPIKTAATNGTPATEPGIP